MKPRVLIVGGGFGGLYAARALKSAALQVTLVDRRNHHIFQPLLYQVATAALNPSDIAHPIRSVLRKQANCNVLLAEVQRVDVARKCVVLRDGELAYDYLILASGATHSYFAHPEWEAVAPGLKTLEDAIEIRRRVLYAFEAAERSTTDEERRALLTFVVIGGGATGVEVAGALAEVAHHALASDFRHINPADSRVLLIEGGESILANYPRDLSEAALGQLKELGVEVWTKARASQISNRSVTIGERVVETRCVVWAAGVKASNLGATLGVPLDRSGRVKVSPVLSLPEYPEVYVIGDLSALEVDGKPVPGVAGAAIQMGQYVARRLQAQLQGETPTEPFRYVEKGTLATIGRRRAVAIFPGGIKLKGVIAWLAWLFIHVMLLIGFRNRVVVVLQWAWAYLTYQRGARLITGPALDEPAPGRQRVPEGL